MRRRLLTAVAACAVTGTLALTACSSDEEPAADGTQSSDDGHGGHDSGETDSTDSAQGDHADMDHPADGGDPPAGITEASDPEFPVGTEVTLSADHMPGMDGATATVTGAFDTYTYAVSYDPTDGGDRVEDHKWVVQEELEGAGADRLADGDTATINAEHMSGMDGAEATIDSSTDETVYMVDVEIDGMTMTNHKWVVESELSAVD